MQVCAIECFQESGCHTRGLDLIRRCPLDRQRMTNACWCSRRSLPMAAREANRSYLADVGFLRYHILANRKRARDDWAGACVTRVRGEVKIVFAHRDLSIHSWTRCRYRKLDGHLSGDRNASPYACFSAFLSNETALSDFPHSRQTRLARGVISPQNGHILCDRTSSLRGLKIASNVPRNFRAEARRRPRDGRYGSIRFSPPLDLG
jgi:hypothetical protein